MAIRRPLVVVNGVTSELPSGDTTPTNSVAPGAARQLLQTNAGGTATEWTSNVDIPGTLDVTSTATFDSIAQYPLGSAGAPTLTFTGDNNTGIYSPGADQVAISTGGSGRLFVDANGNVGVGTSSPAVVASKTLHIYSGAALSGGLRVTGNNGTGIDLIQAADGNGYFYQRDNAFLAIGTNNQERLRITSAGLVGVGTSSPSELLHIAGATNPAIVLQDTTNNTDARIKTNNNGDLVFEADYNGEAADTRISFEIDGSEKARFDSSGRLGVGTTSASELLHLSGASAALQIQDSGATNSIGKIINSSGILYIQSQDNTSHGQIVFRTSDGSATERLRIDSSGRVGIGTSSPGTRLHVTQTLQGNDVSTGAAMLMTTSTATNDRLNLNFSLTGNNDRVRAGIGAVALDSSGGYNCGLAFYTRNQPDGSALAVTDERMRIDSSGRVGIGTTSPSAKLHVDAGSSTLANSQLVAGTSGFLSYCYSSGATGSDFYGSSNASTSGIQAFGSAATYGTFGAFPLVLGTNNTERARIDSSGRLLVGTSSSVGNGSAVQVIGPNAVEVFRYSAPTGNSGPSISLTRSASNTVGTVAAVAATDDLGQVTFRGAGNGTTFVEGASIRATVESGTISGSSLPSRLVLSTTADGAANPTERMRITSLGVLKVSNTGSYLSSGSNAHEIRSNTDNNNVLIVSSAASNGTQYGLSIRTANDQNDATRDFLECQGGGVLRAQIRTNGGLANFSANNANLSDRNAKKDISLAADTWNCVKEWEIVNYRYKDQPDDADLNLGVVAQQVAESCPEVITIFQEAKEATETEPAKEERLGVKEQQMYWMAIKALQEAQVRIETLEARLTAAGIE